MKHYCEIHDVDYELMHSSDAIIHVCPDHKLTTEYIDDGFGSTWLKYCDNCGAEIQVVRPGKAQCPNGCKRIVQLLKFQIQED